MKILGLDVSSKTGFAILDDGKLVDKGLIKAAAVEYDDREPDFGQLARAQAMADQLGKLIIKTAPDTIVIEQTNSGRFRTSQKGLEFTHCLILRWASDPDHFFAKRIKYVDTSKWRAGLSIKLTKEQRTHNKKCSKKLARGKITPKHLAVAWCNATYNLDLLQKDHDIADAICLCAYLNKVGLNPVKVGHNVIDVLQNYLPSSKTVV